MNYIIHLNAFLEKAAGEPWMVPYHYSLYMNLFRTWNKLGFRKTFNIRREETMAAAKIKAKATYYRCLRELEAGGYLIFHPAPTRYTQAAVTMLSLETRKTQQVLPGEPINKTNKKIIIKEVSNGSPTQEEVISFFTLHLQRKEEALKFWYYHSATNWIIASTPVQNWQSLAHKWMLQHGSHKKTLYENSYKDYSEPF